MEVQTYPTLKPPLTVPTLTGELSSREARWLAQPQGRLWMKHSQLSYSTGPQQELTAGNTGWASPCGKLRLWLTQSPTATQRPDQLKWAVECLKLQCMGSLFSFRLLFLCVIHRTVRCTEGSLWVCVVSGMPVVCIYGTGSLWLCACDMYVHVWRVWDVL